MLKSVAVSIALLSISPLASAQISGRVVKVVRVQEALKNKPEVSSTITNAQSMAPNTDASSSETEADLDEQIVLGTKSSVGPAYVKQITDSGKLKISSEITKQALLMATSCTTSTAVLALTIVADLTPFASVVPDKIIKRVDPEYTNQLAHAVESDGANAAGYGLLMGTILSAATDLGVGLIDALPDGRINDGIQDEKYRRLGSMSEASMLSSQYVADTLIKNESTLCHRSTSKTVYIAKEIRKRFEAKSSK